MKKELKEQIKRAQMNRGSLQHHSLGEQLILMEVSLNAAKKNWANRNHHSARGDVMQILLDCIEILEREG